MKYYLIIIEGGVEISVSKGYASYASINSIARKKFNRGLINLEKDSVHYMTIDNNGKPETFDFPGDTFE